MLNLIIAAIQAILQVMTVVFFGAVLARMGYFPMEKQKWLSRVNMVFFTPCLLFSNIAHVISFEKLLAFWPIPVFYAVFGVLSYLTSQTTTRMLGLGAAYRRFVLACVMFSNTNSLPIATISSLAVSEAGKILFWGADDTAESVAARGISYTLFFAVFGNLVRWSYGYSLLSLHAGDDPNETGLYDTIPTIVKHTSNDGAENNDTSTFYRATDEGSAASSISEVGQEERFLERVAMPDRRLSSQTLAAQPDETFLRPSSSAAKIAPSETTSLLGPEHKDAAPTLPANPVIRATLRVARWFNSFMSPPLYAAVLALVVGLSPLKPLLYNQDSFLYPSFTKAIETCGRAAVPIILTCLGAQLMSIAQSTQSASPSMRKPVAAAITVRMVLMPFFVIPIVVAFVRYGSQWSTLASDPVFIVMMIVLGCTPTAINLVQITQVNGIFDEEMLRMLFWSYGVVCVPVCTFTVFVALNIVDRLL